MPTTNDFLPFATGASPNIISQAAWLALAARATGFETGIAESDQANKAIRQSQFQACVVAAFVQNILNINVSDDGNLTAAVANFTEAVESVAQSFANNFAEDTGSANAYAATFSPAVTSLTDGLKLRLRIANANTGASTFSPNGLTAHPIQGIGGVALVGGELSAGLEAEFTYNLAGTAWLITSPSVAVTGVAGSIPIASQGTVNTGTNGSQAVTPATLKSNLAGNPGITKAWCVFSVSGSTCTLIAGENVSSVTYNSTGLYQVNFTAAFADTNYACTPGTVGTEACSYNAAGKLTGSCVLVAQTNNVLSDATEMSAAFFHL